MDTAWQKQRQFVSDASHELKTPLAVIMTNAELLQSADSTGADRRQFSESILTISRQMRALVEWLLELARVESGEKRAELIPLDFSQLTERALLPFEPLFFEKELTLASEIQPEITVAGNAQQLSQLLGILLDNAQKYALPQSEVRLSLRAVNSRRCCLSVSNAAEEISPEQLENLFTRFYRVDSALARRELRLGAFNSGGHNSGAPRENPRRMGGRAHQLYRRAAHEAERQARRGADDYKKLIIKISTPTR